MFLSVVNKRQGDGVVDVSSEFVLNCIFEAENNGFYRQIKHFSGVCVPIKRQNLKAKDAHFLNQV